MKVYVVEVGCYSDRYIARVCESEEAAKKFIQIGIKYKLDSEFEHGNYSIEEYETNDAIFDKTPHYIRLSFSDDALSMHIWDELYDEPFETKKNEELSIEPTSYYKGALWLDTCFEADEMIHMKDPEVVRKICCDRMAEWKAKQAGIA